MRTIHKEWAKALVCLVTALFSLTLNACEGFSDYLDLRSLEKQQNHNLFHQRELERFKKLLRRNHAPLQEDQCVTEAALQQYLSSYLYDHKTDLIKPSLLVGLSKDELILPGSLEQHKKNFIQPTTDEVDIILPNDLLLVNLRGLRQDPQEQIYDQEYPKARLKYFTPLTTALSYDTIGEYCDHNAMLRVWSAYCAMAIVLIPKGSRVVFLLGLAAPQRADQRMLERDAQSLGVDPSFFQHFSPGGGVQLLVIEAPGSTVFDLGSLFKDTGERFISRLGDPGEPQLYLDPIKHFLDEARLKNLHCHLLYKGWVQQLLRFRNFLGLARRIR